MKKKNILFLLSTLLMACGGEEQPADQPTFTRDRPSFTGDRSQAASSPIRLTDITRESGVDFVHFTGAFGEKWMPETIGSGGGFFDYDNDGDPDLLLVNSTSWPGYEGEDTPTTQFYRNRGDGTFENHTSESGLGLSLYGMGAAFADYDADGDLDIYITALGPNKLLRNDGGRFVDVSDRSGVVSPGWSTGAAWLDYDRDGWMDLFVAHYVKWTPETDIYVTRDGKTKSYATPEGYEGETSRLYRNLGNGRFADVTEEAGLLNDEGKSLGVALADFNTDGWVDIVVSNDTQPNFLYINQQDGSFVNTAIQAGVGYDETGRARAGMGIDIADLRNEGTQSIAIGNFSQEPLSLYTQIGSGDLFQDRAGASRLTRPTLLSLTFGVLFADLDADGALDILAANGHIEPEINNVQPDITFEQPPQLFWNLGDTFVDVSEQAGSSFVEPIVGRGIATADIDNDGDLDVLMTANGGPARLFRNDTDGGNVLRLKFEGLAPNTYAVGAQVTAWINGMPISRMVRTGSSYLTQSDISSLHIGLGENTAADSVQVLWPGQQEPVRYGPLESGEILTLSPSQGM